MPKENTGHAISTFPPLAPLWSLVWVFTDRLELYAGASGENLSPPGDQWCNVFVPTGSVSSSSTLYIFWEKKTASWCLLCLAVFMYCYFQESCAVTPNVNEDPQNAWSDQVQHCVAQSTPLSPPFPTPAWSAANLQVLWSVRYPCSWPLGDLDLWHSEVALLVCCLWPEPLPSPSSLTFSALPSGVRKTGK